jgi:hypothetical protein
VYSSLGMVYEDMLQTYRKECEQRDDLLPVVAIDDDQLVANDSAEPSLVQNIDKRFTDQLDLAKKAYGSFHIAAILCRQDYTIWVRAADMALEIAAIHERYEKSAKGKNLIMDGSF